MSAEVFPNRFVAVSHAPAPAPTFIEALRNASRILAPTASGAAEAALAAKLPGFKTDAAIAPDKVLAGLRADPGSVAIVGLFEALVARRSDGTLQADADLLAAVNGHLGQLRSSPSYRMVMARGLGEDALTILSKAHLEPGQ